MLQIGAHEDVVSKKMGNEPNASHVENVDAF